MIGVSSSSDSALKTRAERSGSQLISHPGPWDRCFQAAVLPAVGMVACIACKLLQTSSSQILMIYADKDWNWLRNYGRVSGSVSLLRVGRAGTLPVLCFCVFCDFQRRAWLKAIKCRSVGSAGRARRAWSEHVSHGLMASFVRPSSGGFLIIETKSNPA